MIGLVAAWEATEDRSFVRQLRDLRIADGLDHVRQTLRRLRTANLPDTMLVLCSVAGLRAYPDLLRLLTEPELLDLHHRVLLTTEPNHLARWRSHPQLVPDQRRFMRAARAVDEVAVSSPLDSAPKGTTVRGARPTSRVHGVDRLAPRTSARRSGPTVLRVRGRISRGCCVASSLRTEGGEGQDQQQSTEQCCQRSAA